MRFKSMSFCKLALSALLVLSANICKVSSLAAESNKEKNADIAEVRKLCRNREYLKAWKLCQDYLEKNENSNNVSEVFDIANTFLLIANETYNTKLGMQLTKSVYDDLKEENLELYGKNERFLKLGEVQKNYAVFLRLISKYDDAISQFNKALASYDKALALKGDLTPAQTGKADTLRLKGSLFTLIFDHQISNSCFENALKIIDELLKSNPCSSVFRNMKVRTLIDYAELEHERGEYVRAQNFLYIANKLINSSESEENFGSTYLKIQVLQKLSSNCRRMQNKDACIKYADEAVQLADEAFKKWSDNPEVRILYAKNHFYRLSLDRKKIPIEARNKYMSALESCIENYPESYAIYRHLCDAYETSAYANRYHNDNDKNEAASITADRFDDYLNDRNVKEEVEESIVGIPRRKYFDVSSRRQAVQDFELDLAEASLKVARHFNPDNLILMSDESYLLERRFIPFDITKENVHLTLQKIDSVLAKDNRLLRAHLVKMSLLCQPDILLKGMDLTKIQTERSKELELLNKLIPKRVLAEKWDISSGP